MMHPYYTFCSYPFPFMIPILNVGVYAKGTYHVIRGDQFLTTWTRELTAALLLFKAAKPELRNNTCKSCAKVCQKVTVSGYCCDYEPMDGLGVVDKYGGLK